MQTFTASMKHTDLVNSHKDEFDVEVEAETFASAMEQLDTDYPIGRYRIECIHEGLDHSGPDLLADQIFYSR